MNTLATTEPNSRRANCMYQAGLISVAALWHCLPKPSAVFFADFLDHPEEKLFAPVDHPLEGRRRAIVHLAGPAALWRYFQIHVDPNSDAVNHALELAAKENPEDPLAKVALWLRIAELAFATEPSVGFLAIELFRTLSANGILTAQQVIELSAPYRREWTGGESPFGELNIQRDSDF